MTTKPNATTTTVLEEHAKIVRAMLAAELRVALEIIERIPEKLRLSGALGDVVTSDVEIANARRLALEASAKGHALGIALTTTPPLGSAS